MQESLLTLKLQPSQFFKWGLTSQGTDDESVTTPCKKERSFMLRRGIQESWPTQRWHRRLLSALLPWSHQMYSYTLDNSPWKRPRNYSTITQRGNAHMGKKGWEILAINPSTAPYNWEGTPTSSSEEWRVWISPLVPQLLRSPLEWWAPKTSCSENQPVSIRSIRIWQTKKQFLTSVRTPAVFSLDNSLSNSEGQLCWVQYSIQIDIKWSKGNCTYLKTK